MDRKGMLVVISGFAGVGKGTMVHLLTERYPDCYAVSISATTRQPRENEKNGEDYLFLTREEFESWIAQGRLIEYACYCDNYYGTPKDFVERERENGKDVILEIEQQGGLEIKEKYPDAVMIFVLPPDIKTLVERLHSRGTETEEGICRRLKQAVEEARHVREYEYAIMNGKDINRSVEELHHLIESQHNRTERNLDFIEQIQDELKEL